MKKNAIEEHLSIEGMKYKNYVIDAPTLAYVRVGLPTLSRFE